MTCVTLPKPSIRWEPVRIEAKEGHVTVDASWEENQLFKPCINGLLSITIPKGFEAFFLSNGKDYSAILRKQR